MIHLSKTAVRQFIKETRERALKASPGPWRVIVHEGGEIRIVDEAGVTVAHYMTLADADFIVHARQDILALAAGVEEFYRLYRTAAEEK